jgi:hypothetical protein
MAHSIPQRLQVTLALLVLVLGSATAYAQAAALFVPRPWKNCSTSSCSPSEVLEYLLWSRESDINACQTAAAPTLGGSNAKAYCNTLVHVENGGAPIDEFNVVDGLIKFINSQTSTFPVASSSGGFSLAGQNGELLRTQSFGPLFVERPLTSGKHAWSLHFSLQHTRWESLDGTPLGGIVEEEGRTTHLTSPTACLTDNDACAGLRWSANLRFAKDIAVIGTTFGVSDRLDVSGDVPIERVDISGTSFREGGLSISRPDGVLQVSNSARSVAYGIGDVALRAKYSLRARENGKGFAAALKGQVTLPAGSTDALIGTGKTQTQAAFLGAFTHDPLSDHVLGRASGHFSVGYTWAGSGVSISNTGNGKSNQYGGDFSIDLSDEIDYSAGVDLPVLIAGQHAQPGALTFAADLIGRTLRHGATFGNIDFIGSTGRSESQPFLFEKNAVNLLLGSAGVKACIAHDWLVSANLLFALNDNGMKPGLTPVLAIEKAFLITPSPRGTHALNKKTDGCSGFRARPALP